MIFTKRWFGHGLCCLVKLGQLVLYLLLDLRHALSVDRLTQL